VRDGATIVYNNSQTFGTPWEMQLGAVNALPPGDPSIFRAIAWSALFSIIAAW